MYVSYGRFGTGRLYSYDGARFVARADNLGIRPRSVDTAGYFIDLDGDGWRDFVSVQAAGVELFRNEGGVRFTKAAGISGLRSDMPTHSMAAADYDRDGDLDLFFAHWNVPSNPVRPPAHYLWRNDGRGRFADAGRILSAKPSESGRARTRLNHSFTPVFSDIDGDGDPDLLVAGDFGTSQLLRNEAGMSFVETGKAVLTDENGMGADVGDYDRDGDMDWFVTSIADPGRTAGQGTAGNRLYRNDGTGRFEDATEAAGIRVGGWGWGTCFADFDNDGHPDLFHTNGWFADVDEENTATAVVRFRTDRSRLFMSNGDGTFSERGTELGIRHTGQGRGVVCADYDEDGRVDIFIANHGAAPTVYSNVMETGNGYLAVDLVGRPGNPDAIGAKVVMRTASGTQTQEVRLGSGYLSHGPPVLHFGLGRDRTVTELEVHWPGPGRRVSRLRDLEADRRITVRQPEPEGVLLQVIEGAGSGYREAGAAVAIEANAPRKHFSFSHWVSEGGGTFADARSARTAFTMPDRPVTLFARFLPGPAPETGISVARRWMEVLLQAIRDDQARPTVHARNLFHLSAAMYDAWASYGGTARPWMFGEAGFPCPAPEPPPGGDIGKARMEALSHAAWRIVRHRFRESPHAADTRRNADNLMSALGYGGGASAAMARPAAALGRCIAGFYIERGLEDGSNEANDYASTAYEPVNPELEPARRPGNPDLVDPDRWQPLWLDRFVDQSGVMTANRADFVTPEWGRVTPFSLTPDELTVHRRDGVDYLVYHDPGPPPLFADEGSKLYKWGFALVARWSAQLSPEDGVWIDIAPSGIGNLPIYPERFGDHPALYDGPVQGPGHAANPVTGKPYAPQLVPRGDYARVLAEFWADGPDSETPPGHWFVILNAVNDHPRSTRRFGGEGPVLDPLEWDVKAYFALGGAMHDAAIAAWGIKGWYDSVRPISALRFMASRGQSSDPALPSWSPHGLPLIPGAIEPVGRDDPLAGKRGEHAGKVKLRAWRGPDLIGDPAVDAAGVGWILAENWWPYQRPTFVTPPFAGYVSGHSTFSRAAAEVLTALTGDPFFPGGMSGFPIPANEFLVFERGPSVDMVLQWATYRDAADQSSLSRIWGGIHPPADDMPGRRIGRKIGVRAFRLARSYFDAAE